MSLRSWGWQMRMRRKWKWLGRKKKEVEVEVEGRDETKMGALTRSSGFKYFFSGS